MSEPLACEACIRSCVKAWQNQPPACNMKDALCCLNDFMTALPAALASATPEARERALAMLEVCKKGLGEACESCLHENLGGDDYPCVECMADGHTMYTPRWTPRKGE